MAYVYVSESYCTWNIDLALKIQKSTLANKSLHDDKS